MMDANPEAFKGSTGYQVLSLYINELDTIRPMRRSGILSSVRRIGEGKAPLPNKFSLLQNYPNPFNPSTTLEFSIPQAGHVSIKIYDILGREVDELVNERLNAGTYSVRWNAMNVAGAMYSYTLRTESFTRTRKMSYLK